MKKLILCLFLISLVGGICRSDTRFPPATWKESVDPIASPHARKGGILRFSAFQQPKSLNYYIEPSQFTSAVFDLMYETLLGFDPISYEFVPCLAKNWTLSDDKLSFTFELDPAAKWSDGKPVLAEDVLWTYDVVMDPKNATGPFKVSLGRFSRPEVLGERTIRFRAKENHWQNLASCGNFSIMPKHVYEGQDFNRLDLGSPVVSGAYTVSGMKEQIEVRLARRPDWWQVDRPCMRGTMNFDTIVFRYFSDQSNAFEAFKKGLTDIFAVYSARMWANETIGERFDKNWIVKAKVHNYDPSGFQGFAMNTRRPPFDDLRVRKAMAHLVDRETMIRTMMYNAYFLHRSYCEDLYDSEHPCRNQVFEYNVEKAVALLTEAGYRKNPQTGKLEKDGRPLAFTFLTRESSSDKFIALCDTVFKKLGIEMKIERKDWAAWMRDMDEYNFDITWAAWGGSVFRDPEPMWSSKIADHPSGNNITGFKNAEVDELITRQKTLYTVAERNEVMRQIDKILTDNVPYVLLWYTDATRMLYWDSFGMPDTVLSKFGDWRSCLTYWWYDPDNAAELKDAMENGSVLPKREVDVFYERMMKHVSD
ncbi:MAG: ABC transporter substrate-binding protein [Kiritimatiellae bacterium]|nr:ABC transporter substrate-binding protein [Kiritimatiellia bacterium]